MLRNDFYIFLMRVKLKKSKVFDKSKGKESKKFDTFKWL